jgi:hypothetical protein
MHGPLPPNRGVNPPRPIGVREGRRASRIYFRVTSVLPEKGGERLAKKPPHAAARRSRRRIPQAPPQGRSRSSRRDFPISRGRPSPRVRAGGRDQDYHTEKASAPAPAMKSFPGHFLGFLTSTRVLSGKPAGGRSLHPPIARRSSTLVSSASLRAYTCSQSLILGVHVDSS